jgi:hypothetical protein
MSVTPSHKMLCVASAALLSAVGFLMASAPVGASPMRPLDPATPCASYTFPANLTVKQSDGTTVVLLTPVGSSFQNVAASYSTPGKAGTTTGTASGSVSGQENIDFTANWNGGPGAGSSNHYTGVVNKNLTAQGMSTNNKGAQVVWASAPMTFTCVAAQAPAPVQPPPPQVPPVPPVAAAPIMAVTPDQKQDGSALDFTVKNNSAQDLQCTYTATKVSGNNWSGGGTKSFALKAGASTTLKNAGLPLIFGNKTTYKVDITCQGPNGGQTFEQNFSS